MWPWAKKIEYFSSCVQPRPPAPAVLESEDDGGDGDVVSLMGWRFDTCRLLICSYVNAIEPVFVPKLLIFL